MGQVKDQQREGDDGQPVAGVRDQLSEEEQLEIAGP
jgi:hypothetical protein